MVEAVFDFKAIKALAFGLKTEPPQDVIVPMPEPEADGTDFGMYAGYTGFTPAVVYLGDDDMTVYGTFPAGKSFFSAAHGCHMPVDTAPCELSFGHQDGDPA